MNNLVKERMSIVKEGLTKIKYDMVLAGEKIELQKHNIDEHKKHNDAEIDKKKKEIIESEQQIDKLNKEIILINKHIDVLQNKISDKLLVEKKSSKLLQLESKL